MTGDDEKDDLLGELWARLEAPSPVDGEDLARDPRTEQAMSWMRSAWAELEMPTAPTAMTMRTPAPRGRLLRFAPALAALAAALVAIFSALAFRQSAPVEGRPGRELARQPVIEIKSQAITSRINSSGNLEMRKGRVRLVLVQSTLPQTQPDSDSIHTNPATQENQR